jgi:hypothetical protein
LNIGLLNYFYKTTMILNLDDWFFYSCPNVLQLPEVGYSGAFNHLTATYG